MQDDDLDDFYTQMRGVRPLSAKQRIAPPPARPTKEALLYRRQAASEDVVTRQSDLSDAQVELVGSETPLLFAVPGLSMKEFKRLRQGRLAWESGLDLHGYPIDHAREELHNFIRDARRYSQRVVLVVHGKAISDAGKHPILKSHVNEWLQQIPAVLAFCSALPKDGGTGALYVLLKRDG